MLNSYIRFEESRRMVNASDRFLVTPQNHYTYTSLSIRIIVIVYKISNTIGE